MGGHIENGETPIKAMQREANEEAGMVLTTEWRPTTLLVGPGYCVHFFAAFMDANTYPQPSTKTDEPIELHDYPIVLARTDIVPNLRWLISLACNENLLPVSLKLPVRIEECETQEGFYQGRRQR